uniref:Uncharacterized protein n=1 Tax=Cucumis melo TaxID=3656 RepID=A0A9I9CT87_CUCME
MEEESSSSRNSEEVLGAAQQLMQLSNDDNSSNVDVVVAAKKNKKKDCCGGGGREEEVDQKRCQIESSIWLKIEEIFGKDEGDSLLRRWSGIDQRTYAVAVTVATVVGSTNLEFL